MGAVNPQHYRNAAGVQIIEVIRHLPFSLGNVVKYTYRNARKEKPREDLEKAMWYLEDYVAHPQPAVGLREVPPEVVAQVLEGTAPFEAEVFQALLEVGHASLLDHEAFSRAVAHARAIIQRRLDEVSRSA